MSDQIVTGESSAYRAASEVLHRDPIADRQAARFRKLWECGFADLIRADFYRLLALRKGAPGICSMPAAAPESRREICSGWRPGSRSTASTSRRSRWPTRRSGRRRPHAAALFWRREFIRAGFVIERQVFDAAASEFQTFVVPARWMPVLGRALEPLCAIPIINLALCNRVKFCLLKPGLSQWHGRRDVAILSDLPHGIVGEWRSYVVRRR